MKTTNFLKVVNGHEYVAQFVTKFPFNAKFNNKQIVDMIISGDIVLHAMNSGLKFRGKPLYVCPFTGERVSLTALGMPGAIPRVHKLATTHCAMLKEFVMKDRIKGWELVVAQQADGSAKEVKAKMTPPPVPPKSAKAEVNEPETRQDKLINRLREIIFSKRGGYTRAGMCEELFKQYDEGQLWAE